MAPENDHAARRERAMNFLSGKVLRRTEGDVGGGVSGVLSTTQTKYALFLYEDNTFSFEVIEFVSVSSGGFSIPSESKRVTKGSWEIQIIEDNPYLVLWKDCSIFKRWQNGIGGEGIHLLDGVSWNRYLIRS